MTSKTFKSTMADSRELEVDVIFSNPRLLIKESGNGRIGFVFAPADAPALALAILEAAGWPNEHLATTEILRRLRELDEHVKAVEAEARERAELEAEALELVNGYRTSMGDPTVASFDGFSAQRVTGWLAVARRAREMRTEK